MKILIATDAWDPQTNGVVITLKNLGKQLINNKKEVYYITPKMFKTIPCPTYPEIRLSINIWPKINKIIKKIDPEVVHIATEGPIGFFTKKYCNKHNIKFTTSYHTKFPEYIYERIKIKLVENLAYKFLANFHKDAERTLVTTKSIKNELIYKGFIKNKLKVWTRGVDRSIFKKINGRSFDYKPPIYIYVGRVSVEKNLTEFLDLNIDGTKIVIGNGPMLDYLKKKYFNVLFLGKKDQFTIAKYLLESDVFVFPSKTDTFGVVVIEALAMGLPVAAFPVPGPLDIIGGTKIDVLDWDLKKSIKKALKVDKKDCINLAQKYTWENCAKIFTKQMYINQK